MHATRINNPESAIHEGHAYGKGRGLLQETEKPLLVDLVEIEDTIKQQAQVVKRRSDKQRVVVGPMAKAALVVPAQTSVNGRRQSYVTQRAFEKLESSSSQSRQSIRLLRASMMKSIEETDEILLPNVAESARDEATEEKEKYKREQSKEDVSEARTNKSSSKGSTKAVNGIQMLKRQTNMFAVLNAKMKSKF